MKSIKMSPTPLITFGLIQLTFSAATVSDQCSNPVIKIKACFNWIQSESTSWLFLFTYDTEVYRIANVTYNPTTGQVEAGKVEKFAMDIGHQDLPNYQLKSAFALFNPPSICVLVGTTPTAEE